MGDHKLYKFMIKGGVHDVPLYIAGKEYKNKIAVVLARDPVEARTIAKAGFAASALNGDNIWLDYVEPEEIPLTESRFVAMLDGF